MFHLLYKKMLKKIRNKGTINVLQGGGSVEYGQRPYFYIFFWTLPLDTSVVSSHHVSHNFMHLSPSPAILFTLH